MSDRFIKFNDEQLDAKQVMMLQDLARLLLKNENRCLTRNVWISEYGSFNHQSSFTQQ